MLVCHKCLLSKEEHLFNWTYENKQPVKRRSTCTPCVVSLNKKYREDNREAYNKNASIKRHERKKRAVEYKGGICMNCKQSYHWSAFDFHHVDSSTKHKDPGLMMTHSDIVLFKELDKCVLLCANCHRVEHFTNGY